MKILCVPKDAVFERGEREKIYSQRTKDKKQKKKKSLHISHAHLPPPRIIQKNGIRFTNQRRRGDKKEDRRPEEDHGQEGALVSLSRGSFSDRIPIFFFVSRPKWVSSSKGEKTRPKNEPKKRNIRIFASMRIRPQKPPFRRRQTRASNAEMYREYIGARFDAAASVARRSRGGPFFRQVCSKNKSRKRFAKFLSSKKHLAQKPTGRWEKNEGEILFLVRF